MRSDINTVAGAQSNYAAWPSLNTCKPRSAGLASSHSARITPPAPPPLASIPRVFSRAQAAAALGETHGDEEETASGEWKRMGAVLMREPL
ncbi:unnamed protein product [Gadus morhua 'NCC']